MLLALSLTDFILVAHQELEFHSGFTVLTGETGAGKSILLDALALVLGERADPAVVRAGAPRAEIAAQFGLDGLPELQTWLAEQDLADEAEVLLLRRVVEAGGRSRAYINGRAATVQQLRTAGAWLVEIHGQHAHYALLQAARQRRLLDAHAGCTALAAQVAQAWRAWQTASGVRQAAQAQGEALAEERATLTASVAELQHLAPTPHDWQALLEQQRRLAHAAELVQGAQFAATALDGDEAGIVAQLRAARGRLAELAQLDAALQPWRQTLDDAAAALHETARELHRYAGRVELDPAALAQAESRLRSIQDLARKHHVRPEALAEVLQQASARLQALDASADLAALLRAEQAAAQSYQALAQQLGAARRHGGARLAQAVTATMQALAMPGGAFEVALIPAEAGAHGQEEIVFQVAPHPGQAMQPLARTASGGELSRLGLAVQTVLSATSGAATLIFDEVDAGIGGGVAEIVGRLLAAQGRHRQVLCVTHLAQVAAQADWHYRVSKETRQGQVHTQVSPLHAEARVEELARMLGGVELTPATRHHAAELLRQAGAAGG